MPMHLQVGRKAIGTVTVSYDFLAKFVKGLKIKAKSYDIWQASVRPVTWGAEPPAC